MNSPLWSAVTPEVPAPAEAPTAKPEALAKPAPKAQQAAQTRKSASEPSAESGNKAPGPALASGRQANPGTYETIRPTTLFEKPSGSSRAVSNIGDGTKFNVVGSSGDWLEVRSRLGNPPGFIRRDDAKPVERPISVGHCMPTNCRSRSCIDEWRERSQAGHDVSTACLSALHATSRHSFCENCGDKLQ